MVLTKPNVRCAAYVSPFTSSVFHGTALVCLDVNTMPMQEMWARSLDQDDPLEKEITTHSSILAWEIPWTEEPWGCQRVRHN